jgi:sugar phosphate permease
VRRRGNRLTEEQLFIHEDPEGNGDIKRMKSAVWVVLTNALLWLITTVAAFVYWWGHRERRSRFTGRATV